MKWTKPEIKEIPLGMEMTAYVNTDQPNPARARSAAQSEPSKSRDTRAQ